MTDLSKLQADFASLSVNIGGPPDGIYQGKVSYHRLSKNKTGNSIGNLRVDLGLVIRGGDYNGRKVNIMFDLERETDWEGQKIKFGLKNWKSTLHVFGLEEELMKNFTVATIKEVCAKTVDCIVDFKMRTKNGYQNSFITGLVQNPGEDSYDDDSLNESIDPDEVVKATSKQPLPETIDIDDLLE